MGVQELQKLLENVMLNGGAVSVDLLKIARNVTQRQQTGGPGRKLRSMENKLKLLIDGENCLDRLYGGYFSDWACGGQWNRMVQFLSLLIHAIEKGNIELTVAFNGTKDSSRMNEWMEQQASIRHRVGMVLKHVNTKATPPPKIWWTAPICLKNALRLCLRNLGVTVMCTVEDHHREVVSYCKEYGFHGLLADDGEYIAFNPPRYFSSKNIKLTYKGSLETKEYMVPELAKYLNLNKEQMCVLASLLGNFLFSDNELQDIHARINSQCQSDGANLSLIEKISNYIRNLPPITEMDKIVSKLFINIHDKRIELFKQSISYYLNSWSYAPKCFGRKSKNTAVLKEETNSDFASETLQEDTLRNMMLDIRISNNYEEPNGNAAESTSTTLINVVSSSSSTSGSTQSPKNNVSVITPIVPLDVLRTASTRHQKGLMSPYILHLLNGQVIRLPCLMEDEANREVPPIHEVYKPLRQRIYALLFNLHHHRYVHSKKKENKEIQGERQPPDIIVKEWVYTRNNPYQTAEEVKAVPLSWAVPMLQRLWFGPSVDDKRCRMRALLSCLNSDTLMMLDTFYVPQHLLIMACVLRYIMSQGKPIIRRSELDVFLYQAVHPDLKNTQYLQELTLSVVTSRGVQLAALFMQGVEMALLANDACGAPLPWLMCCPWLFFDGKLFHHTLARTAHVSHLFDLCENYPDRAVKVEKLRKAILDGLKYDFAKRPLQFTFPVKPGIPPPNCLPAVPLPSSRGATNLRHRPISSRGGQLQVAGVVVGSWGANYGYQNARQQMTPQQQQQQQQQVVNSFRMNTPRGGAPQPIARQKKPRPPTYQVNKRPANKKKGKVYHNFTVATPDCKNVMASDLLRNSSDDDDEDDVIVEVCCATTATGAAEHHQGQGDGPSSLEATC